MCDHLFPCLSWSPVGGPRGCCSGVIRFIRNPRPWFKSIVDRSPMLAVNAPRPPRVLVSWARESVRLCTLCCWDTDGIATGIGNAPRPMFIPSICWLSPTTCVCMACCWSNIWLYCSMKLCCCGVRFTMDWLIIWDQSGEVLVCWPAEAAPNAMACVQKAFTRSTFGKLTLEGRQVALPNVIEDNWALRSTLPNILGSGGCVDPVTAAVGFCLMEGKISTKMKRALSLVRWRILKKYLNVYHIQCREKHINARYHSRS